MDTAFKNQLQLVATEGAANQNHLLDEALHRSTWIVMLEKPNLERRSFVAFLRTICESAPSSVKTDILLTMMKRVLEHLCGVFYVYPPIAMCAESREWSMLRLHVCKLLTALTFPTDSSCSLTEPTP